MTAIPPPAHEKRYALQDARNCDLLSVGSNVIGRGPAEVEGLAFIAIESPRGAISRAQATIEIAPNGDAWISDCGSTNGTYISIRPGTGIRLQPDRFYQLSEGSSLVFGDVERRFVAVDAATALLGSSKVRSRAPSSSSGTPAKGSRRPCEERDGLREAVQEASKVPADEASACSPFNGLGRPSDSGTAQGSALREIPYLAELQPAAVNSQRKRGRQSAGCTPKGATIAEDPASTAKTRKGSLPTLQESDAPLQPLTVCTSGLEPEDKAKTRKAVKRHGGSFTDDITKATLLVVGTPPVRTPKFIIAVARGIPIVDLSCVDGPDTLTREGVLAQLVSLNDNGRTYTAKALRLAIHRSDDQPLLKGILFNLHQLRGKGKQVAEEVITGSGGSVLKKKGEEGVRIDSEKALNDLYDQILRGQRPQK